MLTESQGWLEISEAFANATKKIIRGTNIESPHFTTENRHDGMCSEWDELLKKGLVSQEVRDSAMRKIDADLEKVDDLYLFPTTTDEGRLQRVAYALKKSQETT